MVPAHLYREGSFIVRIWWDHSSQSEPVWRGQVIHALTRQVYYFGHLEDLLRFIRQRTGIPQQERGLKEKEENDGSR